MKNSLLSNCFRFFSLLAFISVLSGPDLFASDIVPSTNKIDFGIVSHCQNPQDTLRIRNIGSTNRKVYKGEFIDGANTECFKIDKPKSNDLDLPPYDGTNALVYVIKFVPDPVNPGPKSAVLHIKTDDPLLPEIKIDLAGESDQFLMAISPDPLDFGAIAPLKDITNPITVKNNGTAAQKIFEILKSNPNINVKIADSNVNANSSVSLDVTLNVPIIGTVNETLFVVFDAPCFDTLKFVVKAEVTSTSLFLPQSLSFDITTPCDDVSKTITIKNLGTVDASVGPFSGITGTNPALFELVSDGKTYPIILKPGDELKRDIIFKPAGQPDGIKSAKLNLSCEFNGVKIDTVIDLNGEIRRSIMPNIFNDLGETFAGGNNNLNTPCENKSSFDIVITKVYPAIHYPAVFTASTSIEGKTILIGQSNNINITFSPLGTGTFIDSIKIDYKYGSCTGSFYLVVQGKASGVDTCDLAIGDVNTDPLLDNILSIPITISPRKSVNILKMFADTISIRFDRTMLSVKTLVQGVDMPTIKLLKDSIDGNDRLLIFTFEQEFIPKAGVPIANLNILPLLGDVETSTITFDKVVLRPFDPTNNFKIGNLGFGTIKMKICKAAGNRLVDYVNGKYPILSLNNPVTDKEMKFALNLFEVGEWTLEIFNGSGASVLKKALPRPIGADPLQTITIDVSAFSPGFYMAVLKSPTGLSYQVKVMVQ